MKRRVLFIPFLAQFRDATSFDASNQFHRRVNKQKEEELTRSIGAVFIWLLKGAIQWYSDGLGQVPQKLAESGAQFLADNDDMGAFITECCEICGSTMHRVSTRQLLNEFNTFANANLKSQDFNAMLMDRGFKKGRARIGGKNVQAFQGLRLKTKE